MKKNDDFELIDTPLEAQDPEIKAEDFVLQQADGSIHEQKFQTKPTTFLKDSLKRFRKNKSSVVATYILGALVLLSIFVPIFDKNDVSKAANSAYSNLEPKLFDSGIGWWDGTKHVSNCPVDPQNNYMPDPELYLEGGVTNKVVESEKYSNLPDKFGKDGYLQVGYYSTAESQVGYFNSRGPEDMVYEDSFILDLSEVTLTISNFNVMDLDKLNAYEESKGRGGNHKLPENFDLGQISVEFVYDSPDGIFPVTVIDPALTHDIGVDPNESPYVINDKIMEAFDDKILYENFYFRFKITRLDGQPVVNENVCSLVQNFVVTPSFVHEDYENKEKVEKYFTTETTKKGISGISFLDAMQFVYRPNTVGTGANTQDNHGYWSVTNETKYVKKIYMGRSVTASFDYDSYTATLGKRIWTITSAELNHYKSRKWLSFRVVTIKKDGVWVVDENAWIEPKILNKNRCPVLDITDFTIENIKVDQKDTGGEIVWSIELPVMFYKYLDEEATEMPKFLFGTDNSGRDLFKYVFEGLRNSLILGVITFVICFLFGLLWGAVSGYFGGAVDLVMERVTDILSGVPWIVVMTIIILKAGSSMGTFALALCLTGWIGTASTTRTQFYRFRGREYVLASRTLGASDARLIAKHILPNALGTIITGAVLMIPSVIFSEATISYLGLGFKNLSSLGVILSNNQAELTTHPYQLIFPSVVIALVMISFNLFGNGLRDAINPSLKGEDE